jgi:hypothetical protein
MHEKFQHSTFQSILETLEEVANFHDNAAAALLGDLTNGIKILIKNKTKEREDISRSIAKLEADFFKATDDYDKVLQHQ